MDVDATDKVHSSATDLADAAYRNFEKHSTTIPIDMAPDLTTGVNNPMSSIVRTSATCKLATLLACKLKAIANMTRWKTFVEKRGR